MIDLLVIRYHHSWLVIQVAIQRLLLDQLKLVGQIVIFEMLCDSAANSRIQPWPTPSKMHQLKNIIDPTQAKRFWI